MPSDLIVVGASGFGRETLDVIEALNAHRSELAYRVIGVVDDAPSPTNLTRLEQRGYRCIGGVRETLARLKPSLYTLAIGSPIIRAALVAQFDAAGWKAATLVHPSASVGSRQAWADGVVVCGGAQISTNVHLGRHVHVNPNATIGHDATLNDFVSVNPAAVISGEVVVGARTLIGTTAIVLQGLDVGEGCVVGAACLVTKDVPVGVIVKGVPGRWA